MRTTANVDVDCGANQNRSHEASAARAPRARALTARSGDRPCRRSTAPTARARVVSLGRSWSTSRHDRDQHRIHSGVGNLLGGVDRAALAEVGPSGDRPLRPLAPAEVPIRADECVALGHAPDVDVPFRIGDPGEEARFPLMGIRCEHRPVLVEPECRHVRLGESHAFASDRRPGHVPDHDRADRDGDEDADQDAPDPAGLEPLLHHVPFIGCS